MIQLKDYQQRVLDSLRRFFRLAVKDPAAAFDRVQVENGRIASPYLPVVMPEPSQGLPYICLRVPTGGGKTLLACHAAGIAMNEYLHAERAVVLWLVPSNTILEQTAEALRDPRHPYRRALELECGTVEVVTVSEALQLSRARAAGATVVIVATIQAFRVEDPTGRKVYGLNGALSEHFQQVPSALIPYLRPGLDGKPLPCLVNVLRLRRPIVIVDEAHNARTELSFKTLGEVLPACIIEFTATPDRDKSPSNVLHHVSASELKQANMVKLPLRVVTRHPSQKDQLLADALALRMDLEKLAIAEAQQTGEYLRPMLLIQAERVDACEPLRDRLVQDFGVPRETIKISVGAKDELPGADEVRSPRCPVRVVLTVQKLREGWDCPFAYVLCSLRETRSATAIEQIVGRVLRLPGAKPKLHPDLNCSYAFSVTDQLGEVLQELRLALEANGFTTAEAQRIVLPVIQGALPLANAPQTLQVRPEEIDPMLVEAQSKLLANKATVDAGTGTIQILAPLSPGEVKALGACVNTAEAKGKIEYAAAAMRETAIAYGGSAAPGVLSPYHLNRPFRVPLLCVRENNLLFEFESTYLLEHPWRLSQKDASLRDSYDPTQRPKGEAGKIDVDDKGAIQTMLALETRESAFAAQLHQQVLALEVPGSWSLEGLVVWLDGQIEHHDIPREESVEFLRKVLRGLMAKYGIEDIDTLALDRFRLRAEIELRINEHRVREKKAAFQTFLELGSPLAVEDERSLDFRTITYEPSWNYDGSYQFQKHYFPPGPGELQATTVSGRMTEEAACAEYLDKLDAVEYWIRNLAGKATSFRLQTSSDFFYPDFMCRLVDGRILAVEYKGRDRYDSADSEEKRMIGKVWEGRSGGRCLFCMPTERDFSIIEKLIQQ